MASGKLSKFAKTLQDLEIPDAWKLNKQGLPFLLVDEACKSH
jgi:hypothetical protein